MSCYGCSLTGSKHGLFYSKAHAFVMIVYVFVNECVRDRHDVTVDPMHLLLKGLSTKEIKFKSSTIITEMPRTTNYNFEQFLFYFFNFYFHGWLMIRGICSTISRKSLECLSLKSIFQAAFKLLSDLLKRKLFYRSDVIESSTHTSLEGYTWPK